REYDEAARLALNDPETQVAAALGHFAMSNPSAAFSRLGPLARRYPRAATVRFQLGLMLLWMARTQPGALAEGRRQLRLAEKEQPGSPLAREAKRLIAGLEGVSSSTSRIGLMDRKMGLTAYRRSSIPLERLPRPRETLSVRQIRLP